MRRPAKTDNSLPRKAGPTMRSMGARDFLVQLKDPTDFQIGAAVGPVLGGVSSVKNSRRPGLTAGDRCPPPLSS